MAYYNILTPRFILSYKVSMPISSDRSKNNELAATTTKKRDGLLKTELYTTLMNDMLVGWKMKLKKIFNQTNKAKKKWKERSIIMHNQ